MFRKAVQSPLQPHFPFSLSGTPPELAQLKLALGVCLPVFPRTWFWVQPILSHKTLLHLVFEWEPEDFLSYINRIVGSSVRRQVWTNTPREGTQLAILKGGVGGQRWGCYALGEHVFTSTQIKWDHTGMQDSKQKQPSVCMINIW